MVGRTAWTAGNGVAGLTWTAGIASADLASLAQNNTVVGNITIANGTALDQFMDLSVRCAIASSTINPGADLSFWIYALLDNGTTYGDGQFVTGTKTAGTPTFAPCAVIPLIAGAAQVNLVGFAQGIIIPPGSFKLAMQDNSGFALTAGTQTVMYRTYNINLNN